jgi:hypothetical protein
MKEPRKQHLSEAVAGLISTIVKMMLGLLRTRGLRGLLELPAMFRFVFELRRLSEEFVTLFAAFKAGTRPVPPPAPEPAPQEWQPAPARPAATRGAAVRARTRTRTPRPRRARPRIARFPRPCFGTPAPIAPPRALPKPPVAVRATGPPKNRLSITGSSHEYFIV